MKTEEMVHVLTVIDGESEELVDLLELKNFQLEDFQRQFAVDTDLDPDMRDRYAVGPDDTAFLNSNVGLELQFDFSTYAYFIEAARKNPQGE
jgi:hypothetical protein